jgi:hypothetical protein
MLPVQSEWFTEALHALGAKAAHNMATERREQQRRQEPHGVTSQKTPFFRNKRPFSSPQNAGRYLSPVNLIFDGYRCISPQVMRSGNGAHRSFPSHAEFKYLWSYKSTQSYKHVMAVN